MRISFDLSIGPGTQPEVADALAAAGAGECWSSPQEMANDKPGSYPHGRIDECSGGAFYRIWDDHRGVWMNSYA